jgi:hypothetical protein
MLGWLGAVSIKSARTSYADLVFLHPVGSEGHVVHSGASVLRNFDAIFSMLHWDRCGSQKKRVGHGVPNLCFCIQWDLWVTLCIPVSLECQTSTHYFSSSGGSGVVSIKSTAGHVH